MVRMPLILKELIFLYKRVNSGQIHPLIEPKENGNLTERLLSSLLPTRNPSNKGGWRAEDWNNWSNSKHEIMLRGELANKLYPYAFLLNSKPFVKSAYARALIDVLRLSTAGRILMTIGFYNSGVFFMEKAIVKAINLDSWDIVLSLSTILSQYYSLRGSIRVNEFNDLADKSVQLIICTRDLRKILNRWTVHFGKKRKAKMNEIDELQNDITRAENIVQEGNNPGLKHYYYRIKLFYLDAVMDYKNALKLCDEAIGFIYKHSKIPDNNKIGIYTGTQMYCFLNLKRFEEARDLAETIELYFTPGTINWFNVMEYYFVLSVQTANYIHAYELLAQVTSNAIYPQLTGSRRKVWRLLEAYMQFIINSGIWVDKPPKIQAEEFKIARFMNEVGNLSRDKTGFHVSILILQIMFWLNKAEYGAIIQQQPALKRYIYRHLYARDNERARLFLTFLSRMVDYNFRYADVETGTKRLFNALRGQEMNYVANLGGNEIVDYELLWSWVLDRLKENWSVIVDK